ncbi:MAG: hypothetical protein AAF492_33550, partial [Verrucomicrobiota bacterium]
MPFKEQGVIDVVADEARGLLYIVTCEDQHWMLYDMKVETYRELGPMLTPYATTLIDGEGRAHALDKSFNLVTYDPETGRTTKRSIELDGQPFTRANRASIPTWNLAADGRTAWLILMNDATLVSMDLGAEGETVKAVNHGKMTEGDKPDSRSALIIAPDGRIYTLIRTQNNTGFGTGMLHNLHRYDPARKQHEDLGVLTVKNPDFFNFEGVGGKKPPWSHGYHHLPDGTLTPLHNHMALIAARDGTLYATIIYPFTLLKIEGVDTPSVRPGPAEQYLKTLESDLHRLEKELSVYSMLGTLAAERYDEGGLIGFHWLGSTLEQ